MIKKIGILAGALTVSASVAALAAAMPASAAHQATVRSAKAGRQASAGARRPGPGSLNQPAQYTFSAPGYGATGADFTQATATTTLRRDVGQFSSSYQPFISVFNDSTSPEVELIPISNGGTPVDAWNPNADLGGADVTGGFFWVQPTPYPKNSACYGNTDPRGCFYAGETVTLTVSYNTATNRAYMTITDKNNGNEYSAATQYASAQQLTSVHIGDLWLKTFPDGGTFTPSSRARQLGTFSAVTLSDSSGHTKPLGSWEHYQRIMTSDGTAKGQVDISPSPLSFDGTEFSLSVR
jgi:hypothetical protein